MSKFYLMIHPQAIINTTVYHFGKLGQYVGGHMWPTGRLLAESNLNKRMTSEISTGTTLEKNKSFLTEVDS